MLVDTKFNQTCLFLITGIICLATPAIIQAQGIEELLPIRGENGEIILGLGRPTCVAFSPDGPHFAVASSMGLTLWEVRDGKPVPSLFQRTGKIIFDMQFVPGKNLLLANSTRHPILWDLDQNKELWNIQYDSDIYNTYFKGSHLDSLDVSPDGKYALIGGSVKTVVMEIETGEVIQSWKSLQTSIGHSAFSLDGKSVMTIERIPNTLPDSDRFIHWKDIESGEITRTYTLGEPYYGVEFMTFSADGRFLLVNRREESVGNTQSTFSVLDLVNEKLHTEFTTDIEGELSGGLSYDGRYAIVGGRESPQGSYRMPYVIPDYSQPEYTPGTPPRIWDLETGEEAFSFQGGTRGFSDIYFSPDDNIFITKLVDKTLLLWSIEEQRLLSTFPGFSGSFSDAVFTPDGSHVVSCSGGLFDHETAIRIWDTQTGSNTRVLTDHTSEAICVNISKDGQFVAAGAIDGTAKVWRFDTGAEILTLDHHTGPVEDIVFSPQGDRIATASMDGLVIIWNAMSGEIVRTFETYENPVNCVDFSPDGEMIALGRDEMISNDSKGKVLLWEVATGNIIHELPIDRNTVLSIEFSPDGSMIFAGLTGNEAHLWDVASGIELDSFPQHGGGTHDVSFSPDGRFFATGCGNVGAHLFDAETREEIRTFELGGSGINVDISPKGTMLINNSIWDISQLTAVSNWMIYEP